MERVVGKMESIDRLQTKYARLARMLENADEEPKALEIQQKYL